jgi:hypothetical protein
VKRDERKLLQNSYGPHKMSDIRRGKEGN